MEKVSLPIKTKIAAWWIGLIGIIIIGVGITVFFTSPEEFLSLLENLKEASYSIFIGGIVVLFSFSLFKRKKIGWWINIILLSIGIISYLRGIIYEMNMEGYSWEYLLGVPILLFIPFILLLLDRKNFWKVAR